MNIIFKNFSDDLESIFYYYLNTLQNSRTEHLSKKASLNQLLSNFTGIGMTSQDIEALRNNPLIVIKNYNKPNNENILHSFPHAKAVDDSAPYQKHEQMLGASVVVEAFNLWENTYREKIAKLSALNVDDIKNDFWGDTRLYRNSISHNQNRANIDMRKCILLPAYKKNSLLKFNDDFIVSFFYHAINSVGDLHEKYSP